MSLLIKNGTIVTSTSEYKADILVEGEKIVDIGKMEITTEKPHQLNWSPLIGIAVMGVGGVFLWQASRKK